MQGKPLTFSLPSIVFRWREWMKGSLWPALGLILVALLWVNTFNRVEQEKKEAESQIRAYATIAADSYAQQVRHMVSQIDHITLRLKYQWEKYYTLNLEEERVAGLFPESQMLFATIFNEKGIRETSTILNHQQDNVSSFPNFKFHQENCCTTLLISPQSRSPFLDGPVVRFSRRLNDQNGEFAGIAVVSVDPAYLVPFQENINTNKDDFISLRFASGPVLASKVGERTKNVPIFYRKDPTFPADTGVLLEPASKFRDGQARFVAWKKIENYPLVAVAGFSAREALLPYEETAARYRETAAWQSLLVFLLTLAAAYVTSKLAKRRREVEETQETYRLATDAANEGFCMLRPVYNRQGDAEDFRIEDCNNRAADLIGTTRERLVGTFVSHLSPEPLKKEIFSVSRLALEKGFIEEEVRVSPKTFLQPSWLYRRVVRAKAGLAWTIRDISEEKEHVQALANLANSDMLTNLPNRNWLSSFLPNAIDHAANATRHLAVLFIDLDNFKNVNDTLGHDAGDELLVQTSARLKSAVRTTDHVIRLGGDEFVVILESVDIEKDVTRVAKAILKTVNRPFSLTAGIGNEVNASIGISIYPQDGKDADTLLKHADIAMYAAKAAGKGRYALYHTHLSDSLMLKLDKERALREAVSNDEFVMHYQPRVGVHSGCLTSMEALIRWERPQHGLLYPSEFIDIAEDNGLIAKIGELVIEKVCRQLQQWRKQGVKLVPVSVNVSSLQLRSGTLSDFIGSCLHRFDIEPALIEVELTESVVIERSVVVTEELSILRRMGIKLMIDDFGTGYSSMAQLHSLDVDVLKVDRGFTQALSKGEEGKYLFHAIISMANALDLCVVAEGVETMEELTALQALSCDEVQGYLISKAVAADEMTQLMIKRFFLPASEGGGRRVHV
jgi:diguanylate cyclase (GGDEF)-like protein